MLDTANVQSQQFWAAKGSIATRDEVVEVLVVEMVPTVNRGVARKSHPIETTCRQFPDQGIMKRRWWMMNRR